jgi:hypothetical protein
MKVYFGHSKIFDYKNELYRPVRESALDKEHEIIFPHEKNDLPTNSKEFLKTCDLMIAEVSFPATGLGIELGWADAFDIPILLIHKKGSHISNSSKLLTDNILEYSDSKYLVKKLEEFINGL